MAQGCLDVGGISPHAIAQPHTVHTLTTSILPGNSSDPSPSWESSVFCHLCLLSLVLTGVCFISFFFGYNDFVAVVGPNGHAYKRPSKPVMVCLQSCTHTTCAHTIVTYISQGRQRWALVVLRNPSRQSAPSSVSSCLDDSAGDMGHR